MFSQCYIVWDVVLQILRCMMTSVWLTGMGHHAQVEVKGQEVKVFVTQLCPTLCDPMDCSPSVSTVHGILQARILELVVILFSRGSSQPRDQTRVSHIASRLFTIWTTREAPNISQTPCKLSILSLRSLTVFTWDHAVFLSITYYLLEAGFSMVAVMKSKTRRNLSVEQEMMVAGANQIPRL